MFWKLAANAMPRHFKCNYLPFKISSSSLVLFLTPSLSSRWLVTSFANLFSKLSLGQLASPGHSSPAPPSALRPPLHRHRLLSGSLPLVRMGRQVNCSGGMSGIEWIEVIMVVGNCQMSMVIVGNWRQDINGVENCIIIKICLLKESKWG